MHSLLFLETERGDWIEDTLISCRLGVIFRSEASAEDIIHAALPWDRVALSIQVTAEPMTQLYGIDRIHYPQWHRTIVCNMSSPSVPPPPRWAETWRMYNSPRDTLLLTKWMSSATDAAPPRHPRLLDNPRHPRLLDLNGRLWAWETWRLGFGILKWRNQKRPPPSPYIDVPI